jgi:hypothetical protein
MLNEHRVPKHKLTQISNKDAGKNGYFYMVTSTVSSNLFRYMKLSPMTIDVILGILVTVAPLAAATKVPVDTIGIALLRPAWDRATVEQVAKELRGNGLSRYNKEHGRSYFSVRNFRLVYGCDLDKEEQAERERCDELLRSFSKKTVTGILDVFHAWNTNVLPTQSPRWHEDLKLSTEIIKGIRNSLKKRGVKSICAAIKRRARKLEADRPNAGLTTDILEFLNGL